MPMLSKRERLALILSGLAAEPAAASEAGALALIERVMDAVEDAHSGVQKDPNHHLSQRTDGRMYAPHARFRLSSSSPECACYRQAAHKTAASRGLLKLNGGRAMPTQPSWSRQRQQV